MQRFAEKAFGRLGIAGWAQKKLERVPLRIHRPVKIRPDFFHFDVGLVHFPGVVAGFQMRPTAFFNLWGILLNPAEDRGVIVTNYSGPPREVIVQPKVGTFLAEE